MTAFAYYYDGTAATDGTGSSGSPFNQVASLSSAVTTNNISGNSVSINVTNASIADCATIAALGVASAFVDYVNLSDTAANLATDAATNTGAGTYIPLATGNVTVSDAASITQLTAIDAALGTGTLLYTDITDIAADLVTNTGTYVTGSVNVTVSDAATIAQLTTIDGFTTGTLTAATLSDSATNLNADAATNSGAGTYLTNATDVTISGVVSIANVTLIDAATAATLTYTLSDTYQNVLSNDGGYNAGAAIVYITGTINAAEVNALVSAQPEIYITAAITDTSANLQSMSNAGMSTITVSDTVTAAVASLIQATTTGTVTATVSDTAANLVDNISSSILATYQDYTVTVSDAATIAQLTTITGVIKSGNTITVADITDEAANLAADAATNTNAGTYIPTATGNVTVSDAASIAQLTGIDAVVTGTLVYTDITDTATNLVADAGTYVTAGTNVTVSDAISIADLDTIHGYNTTGGLVYSISDTYANITATLGLSYVGSATDVAVSDTSITAANANVIDALTDGVVTATVADTIANLITLTGTGNAYAVTVSDAATIADLALVDAATTGTIACPSVTDTAVNLAADAATNDGAGTYVTGATTVTITDQVTIAQLTAIDTASGAATLVYTHIVDSAANLAAAGSATYETATAVTVTDAATLAQLATIDGYTTVAIVYSDITDTAANLVANAGGYVNGSVNVTVSDAAAIADLTTIAALTTGTFVYGEVADTSANLLANAGGYVTGDHAVTVTDAEITAADAVSLAALTTGVVSASVTDTAANLAAITETNNAFLITVSDATIDAATANAIYAKTAMGVVATVTDTAANLATLLGTNVYTISVTDPATIAELTTITAATSGQVAYTAISDTIANLLDDLDGGSFVVNSVDVNVTDAASITELDTVFGNTAGTFTYGTVMDTAADLTVNSGSYVSGSHTVTVTDDQITTSDANTIAALTTGAVTATIVDTAANLSVLTETGNNYSITVTDSANIALITSLQAATTGSVTFNSVTDTASNIVGYSGNLPNSLIINVVGTATISQLHDLEGMIGEGTLNVAISDTAANIATALSDSTDAQYLANGYTITDSGNITSVNGVPTAFDDYTGPVSGLSKQYIASSNDLNVIIGDNNGDFLKGGTGTDAIAGGSSTDVIDGGTGSNFLTGNAGWDRFFVDLRGSGTTWSTVTDYYINDANFLANEQVAIFTPGSFDPNVAKISWVENAGATGYTGATMNISLHGDSHIDASVTFSGKSVAQMQSLVTESTSTQIGQNYGLIWVK